MARKRKALVLFALGIALLLPVFAYAQGAGDTGAGFVPCGVSNDPLDATECQACNLVQLIQNIINFLVGITVSVAAVMFAWAGILYFTSGSKPENINKGKAIFFSTFFGFLIAITAWIVINTLLFTILDEKQYSSGSWFHIECVSQGSRPRESNVSELFKTTIGVVVQSDSRFCPTGQEYVPARDACYDPSTGYEGPVTVNPERTEGLYEVGPEAVPTLPDRLFAFNDGIDKQVAHASVPLRALLLCMGGEVPGNVGRISSISDSDIVSGRETFATCARDGQAGGCAHSASSCHYGGASCVGKSYAVDFGDEQNALALTQAAQKCGQRLSQPVVSIHEGDHVHISVGSSCGCR